MKCRAPQEGGQRRTPNPREWPPALSHCGSVVRAARLVCSLSRSHLLAFAQAVPALGLNVLFPFSTSLKPACPVLNLPLHEACLGELSSALFGPHGADSHQSPFTCLVSKAHPERGALTL